VSRDHVIVLTTLTPWNRDLKKLAVPYLAFYGSRRLINVHRSSPPVLILSWLNPAHVSTGLVLILFHLRVSVSFLLPKPLLYFHSFPMPATCPSRSYIWRCSRLRPFILTCSLQCLIQVTWLFFIAWNICDSSGLSVSVN
jgi:hypothetical protein